MNVLKVLLVMVTPTASRRNVQMMVTVQKNLFVRKIFVSTTKINVITTRVASELLRVSKETRVLVSVRQDSVAYEKFSYQGFI